MRLKALLGLLLAVVLAGALAACGGGDKSAGEGAAATAGAPGKDLAGKKLAFVSYGADAYQLALGEAFKHAAEARGATATVIDGKVDASVQINAVDDLIAQGIDGVGWVPVDPPTAKYVRMLQEANIPTVLLGVAPPADAGIKVPFVAFNNDVTSKKAGEQAAHYVIDEMKQTPRMVILDDKTEDLCTVQRMQAFIDGVNSVASDAKIVARPSLKADRSAGLKFMEDQIQTNANFNLVTACGAEAVLGGVQALEGAGRCNAKDNVPDREYVFAIDGTPEEIKKLLDPNSCVMSVMMLAPKTDGETLLKTLGQVIGGEIKPDQAYSTEVYPTLLTPDCKAVRKLFAEQYGESIDCAKS